ncbi:DinB family protein [Daejeonella oryzae]|uniref:DinB family protein n=1 Tax=Daejeonella oryzae TaxID=1122943 RepID=UPI0004163907|nr:DinB family protein [Daejeonella oryzae]
MKSILVNYLRYNHWANQKMCNYLSTIDYVEENSSKQDEYFAIKNIMLHIADGEQTWLSRLNGENIPHMHNLDLNGSFKSICHLILNNSKLFIEFADQKKDSFFKDNTEYINLKGVNFKQNNAEIILHCMNHSTFHRGQVINMLRHVGYTDQSASDFIMFLREQEAESSIEN